MKRCKGCDKPIQNTPSNYCAQCAPYRPEIEEAIRDENGTEPSQGSIEREPIRQQQQTWRGGGKS